MPFAGPLVLGSKTLVPVAATGASGAPFVPIAIVVRALGSAWRGLRAIVPFLYIVRTVSRRRQVEDAK